MQRAHGKNIWDMLRSIEAAMEASKENSSVVIQLIDLLANPDWVPMATRVLPVGVARDNFIALNLSIISRGGSIVMENAAPCAKEKIKNLPGEGSGVGSINHKTDIFCKLTRSSVLNLTMYNPETGNTSSLINLSRIGWFPS